MNMDDEQMESSDGSNMTDELDRNDSGSTTPENDDAEIAQAVLKTFGRAEEMSASQKNF